MRTDRGPLDGGGGEAVSVTGGQRRVRRRRGSRRGGQARSDGDREVAPHPVVGCADPVPDVPTAAWEERERARAGVVSGAGSLGEASVNQESPSSRAEVGSPLSIPDSNRRVRWGQDEPGSITGASSCAYR